MAGPVAHGGRKRPQRVSHFDVFGSDPRKDIRIAGGVLTLARPGFIFPGAL